MGFEVIVVGAGPTGLMLAAELALADVRTRVVERRTEATRNSRALTLHPRSVELMDLRGIARRFLSEGPTAPGWHFANLPTPLDFSRLDSRRGYTLVLPQARTEAILETRARELGVRIDRGQQVVGLEHVRGERVGLRVVQLGVPHARQGTSAARRRHGAAVRRWRPGPWRGARPARRAPGPRRRPRQRA